MVISKTLINDVVKLVDGYNDEELDELVEKVKKERERIRKKNEDPLSAQELADEIFKICPDCNFIPLAIETTCECTYTTSIDVEEIDDYLSEEEKRLKKNKGFILPHQNDDMKIGDWKKIPELRTRLAKKIGLRYNEENGDYCGLFHLSVCGWVKEMGKHEWFYDING